MAKTTKYHLFSFLVALFLPFFINGQKTDTSLQLNVLQVTDSRLHLSAFGKKEDKLDSLQWQQLQSSNISEALSSAAHLHIKDYGPGMLSTASIRGLGANHTAILWNGINIQNQMLGLNDLNLFPVFLSEDVIWQKGGSSNVWGSGAMSGSIHLNSKIQNKRGWQAGFNQSIGSFGNSFSGLKAGFGGKRFSSATKLFFRSAKNDFPFVDASGNSKRQSHAQQKQMGWLQEGFFEPGARQKISYHLWLQNIESELPPTLFQLLSEATQKDKSIRGLVTWQHLGNKYLFKARTAYVYDHLLYEDPVSNTYSDSHISTFTIQADAQIQIKSNWKVHSGLQYDHIFANTNVYDFSPSQNKTALFIATQISMWEEKSKILFSLRQELVDEQVLPPMPSIAWEGILHKNILLKASVSRNYRLPTFNDLYWPESGNPSLKPESGWSEELSLLIRKNLGANKLQYEGGVFNRNLQNYILWLPEGNLWKPQNVHQVWSRGIEQKISGKRTIGDFQLTVSAHYDYIRSTNEKTNTGGNKKQLIYVPEHKASGSIKGKYTGWYFSYTHTFSSKLFTLEDNTNWLPAFDLGNFQFSKEVKYRKLKGLIFLNLYNTWKEDYQIVVGRPMAGRRFGLGVRVGVG